MNIVVLKVLILGGTTFLGPHLVYELLERGHEVTLFNRGNNPVPFQDEVEVIIGDRAHGFESLKGRTFDVVIDTSGTLPRIVEISAKALRETAQHYTFISTIGVYKKFTEPYIDEKFPVAELEEDSEEITDVTYGALKARSEKIVESYFPGRSLIVRPGLIVGPLDPTGRFAYWPSRIVEGGEILAPGDPSAQIQYIDVRDLSKWIVKMIEEKATGVYNATGPATPLTFEGFLKECQSFSPTDSKITWTSEDFLLKHEVQDWVELPLWLSSKRKMPCFLKVSNKKAIKAGLTFSPLSRTIADILTWEARREGAIPGSGLSRDREKNLLELWSKRLPIN